MGYDIDNRFQKPDLLSATVYQRRLPHVRVDGATYFINFNIAAGTRDLEPPERTVVLDALEFFHMKRYRLHAAVVMNDHVHVVARLVEGIALERVTHSWKSFTANRLQREHGRTFDVWQDESEDRVLRSWWEVLQKTVKFYGFDGAGAEACPTIERLMELYELEPRSTREL